MGRLSRIEHPLFVRIALAVWQRLGGSLNLHEARETRFASIHDCFIRELKDGARPIDRPPICWSVINT
jgi:phosphatidylserine decarboxylase